MHLKLQIVWALCMLVLYVESTIVLDVATTDTVWYHYKQRYDKNYDDATEMSRKPAFLKSLRYIITKNLEHDLTDDWYTAGLNAVADFTADERNCHKHDKAHSERPTVVEIRDEENGELPNYRENGKTSNDHLDVDILNRNQEQIGTADEMHVSEEDVLGGNLCCSIKPKKPCPPPSVDWTSRVTKVGTQQCGDCYAWASTYALSAAWAIKKMKNPLDLSVQQSKDCSYGIYTQPSDNETFNTGCDGGDAGIVYEGLKNQTKGKIIDDYYPKYNDDAGILTCNTTSVNQKNQNGAIIQSYEENDTPTDCELMSQIHKGPVVANMCPSIQLEHWKAKSVSDTYSNLACTTECLREENVTNDNTFTSHDVLIVGYTNTSWIVQNSWGTNWGFNGIGHLAKGTGPNHLRICNLATQIYRPIV